MSNTINASQLLMQMGQYKKLAAQQPNPNEQLIAKPMNIQNLDKKVEQVTNQQNQVNFGDLLSSAVKQVNNMQQEAGQLKKDFEMGKEGVDLVQVMIASEKSSVAFTALLEVRNKMMKAYQEVKNIRV